MKLKSILKSTKKIKGYLVKSRECSNEYAKAINVTNKIIMNLKSRNFNSKKLSSKIRLLLKLI